MIIISYKEGQKFTKPQSAIVNHCINHNMNLHQAIWNEYASCRIIPDIKTFPRQDWIWIDFFEINFPEFGIELVEEPPPYYRISVDRKKFKYPLSSIQPKVFRQYKKTDISLSLLVELHKNLKLPIYTKGFAFGKLYNNIPNDNNKYIPIASNKEGTIYTFIKITDDLKPYMKEKINDQIHFVQKK